MARNGRSPDNSPRVAGSAPPANQLLRLGKLARSREESMIITIEDDGPGCVTIPAPTEESDQSLLGADGRDGPVVETDICLQDFDDDEIPGNSVPVPAPGSTAGRKLMLARAQQCVVCMEDKEHTFVPPHRDMPEGCSGHQVGHRFCTDCWIEFLYHCSRRRGSPAALACPCCRSAIDVPDVWGVTYELPSQWMRCTVETQGFGALVDPVLAEPLHLWAEKAPGAAINDAASTAQQCGPVPQGTQGRQTGFVAVSC